MEEKLSQFLPTSSVLHSFSEEVDGEISFVIAAAVTNEREFAAWLAEFETLSKSHWIVRNTYPNQQRAILKKDYVCHHSSFNKKKMLHTGSEEDICSKKCTDCLSKLSVKIHACTKSTRRTNCFVKQNKPAEISVKWLHNHPTESPLSLKFPPSRETKDKFMAYFADGKSVRESLNYHQTQLELTYEESTEFQAIGANGAVNPPYRRVSYWYDQFRNEHLGDRTTADKIMMDDNCDHQNDQACTSDNIALISKKMTEKDFDRKDQTCIHCQQRFDHIPSLQLHIESIQRSLADPFYLFCHLCCFASKSLKEWNQHVDDGHCGGESSSTVHVPLNGAVKVKNDEEALSDKPNFYNTCELPTELEMHSYCLKHFDGQQGFRLKVATLSVGNSSSVGCTSVALHTNDLDEMPKNNTQMVILSIDNTDDLKLALFKCNSCSKVYKIFDNFILHLYQSHNFKECQHCSSIQWIRSFVEHLGSEHSLDVDILPNGTLEKLSGNVYNKKKRVKVVNNAMEVDTDAPARRTRSVTTKKMEESISFVRNQVKQTKINQAKETKINQAKETKINQLKKMKLNQVKKIKLNQLKKMKLNQVKKMKKNQVKKMKIIRRTLFRCDAPIQEDTRCCICQMTLNSMITYRMHFTLFHSGYKFKESGIQCTLCKLFVYNRHFFYLHFEQMHNKMYLDEAKNRLSAEKVFSFAKPIEYAKLLPARVGEEKGPVRASRNEERNKLVEAELIERALKNLVCCICRVKVESMSSYQEHFALHHPTRQWSIVFSRGVKCSLCSQKFVNKPFFELHFMKKHSSIYYTRRNRCSFKQKRGLYSYAIPSWHTSAVGTLPPPEDANLVNDEPEDVQLASNEDRRDQTCVGCQRRFDDVQSLQLHIESVHRSIDDFHLFCPLCCFASISLDNFNQHTEANHSRESSLVEPKGRISINRTVKVENDDETFPKIADVFSVEPSSMLNDFEFHSYCTNKQGEGENRQLSTDEACGTVGQQATAIVTGTALIMPNDLDYELMQKMKALAKNVAVSFDNAANDVYHKTATYTCNPCSKVFKVFDNLVLHILKCHMFEQCSTCGSITLIASYVEHLRRKHSLDVGIDFGEQVEILVNNNTTITNKHRSDEATTVKRPYRKRMVNLLELDGQDHHYGPQQVQNVEDLGDGMVCKLCAQTFDNVHLFKWHFKSRHGEHYVDGKNKPISQKELMSYVHDYVETVELQQEEVRRKPSSSFTKTVKSKASEDKQLERTSLFCGICSKKCRSKSDYMDHFAEAHHEHPTNMTFRTGIQCTLCSTFLFSRHFFKLHFENKHSCFDHWQNAAVSEETLLRYGKVFRFVKPSLEQHQPITFDDNNAIVNSLNEKRKKSNEEVLIERAHRQLACCICNEMCPSVPGYRKHFSTYHPDQSWSLVYNYKGVQCKLCAELFLNKPFFELHFMKKHESIYYDHKKNVIPKKRLYAYAKGICPALVRLPVGCRETELVDGVEFCSDAIEVDDQVKMEPVSDEESAGAEEFGRIEEVADVETFVCNICNFPCSSDHSLEQHLIDEHPNPPTINANEVRCTICSEHCLNKRFFELHFIDKHRNVYINEENEMISRQALYSYAMKLCNPDGQGVQMRGLIDDDD